MKADRSSTTPSDRRLFDAVKAAGRISRVPRDFAGKRTGSITRPSATRTCPSVVGVQPRRTRSLRR
jgi:hypothetical protein